MLLLVYDSGVCRCARIAFVFILASYLPCRKFYRETHDHTPGLRSKSLLFPESISQAKAAPKPAIAQHWPQPPSILYDRFTHCICKRLATVLSTQVLTGARYYYFFVGIPDPLLYRRLSSHYSGNLGRYIPYYYSSGLS